MFGHKTDRCDQTQYNAHFSAGDNNSTVIGSRLTARAGKTRFLEKKRF